MYRTDAPVKEDILKFVKYSGVIVIAAALIAGAAFFPFERFIPEKPTESETPEITETEAPTTKATEPPETEAPYEEGTIIGNIFLSRRSTESLEGLGPEEVFQQLADLASGPLKQYVKIWGSSPEREKATYRSSRMLQSLGIALDEEAAKETLGKYVLTGSQEEMKAQAEALSEADPVYLTDFIRIDEARFLKAVSPLLPEEKEPVNASVSVDPSGKVSLLSDSEEGFTFDTETALQDVGELLRQRLEGGETEERLEIHGEVVKAVLNSEDVQNFSVLGDYTTTFDVSASERNKNLLACVTHMNGTVVAPHEVCSALKMYGDVTEENGYAGAPTMIDGQHVLDIGGGMCQPTSTLYNAVLLSEMEVVYRSNHSMYVNYGGPGRDAMVYAKNGSDFKFRNSKDTAIIVAASIDLQQGSLNVKIVGVEDRAPDRQISFRWETWDYVMPTVTRTIDPTAPIGYTAYERKAINTNEQWPQCGFKCNLYKVITEGGKTWEEVISKNDVYRPANSDFLCAPDFTVVVRFNQDSPLTAYLDVYYAWLDETPTGVNIGQWKKKDIRAFNARMKQLLAEEGYNWPYSGTAPFK